MGKKLDNISFIKKARQVHGDKYDYSQVEYIKYHSKVCIICPEHGEFWQTPCDHLNGHGCKKCFNEFKRGKSRTLNTEQFIEQAKEVHGDKYDYSKVNYVNSKTKVCIICHEHGEFWQTPNEHLEGCGCRKCSYEKSLRKPKKDINIFIEDGKKVHGDKYDYSKVEYVNNKTKVCIICPKHGEFWQTPHSHLSGKGCPHCKTSHMEDNIKEILEKNNIKYILHERKLFNNKLELDFFLPDYNIAIECQGLQHFKVIEHFGGVVKYKKTLKNDLLKKTLCDENKIKLIYYSEIKNFVFPYTVITNKEDIIKEIRNGKSI